MFPRSEYYSQKEAIKKFRITINEFQTIIESYNLDVVEKNITLHTEIEGLPYQVKTKYVNKIEFIGAFALYKKWVDGQPNGVGRF